MLGGVACPGRCRLIASFSAEVSSLSAEKPGAFDPSALRVLHFGRFYDDQFGGIERHVSLLLAALAGRGALVRNLVAADSWRGDVLIRDAYEIHRVPSLGRLASTAMAPAMFSALHRLHRQFKFQLVHLHFPDPLSHWVAATLPADVARVVTWHSDIVRQKNLLRFYRPFLTRFLGRADALIAATPAHFQFSEQLDAVPPSRRHVVPYGLNYAAFTSALAVERGRALRQRWGDGKFVFALGRHVYYKGFDTLISAMAQLPELTLILGGQGPLSDQLKAQARRLLPTERVRFVGRLPDEDLPSYYHAADIFCLPSREPSEAFGLVQLEAMACGKPVVSCDLPSGVPYVNRHQHSGLLVPPGDVAALAMALRTLAGSPELCAQLGMNGQQRALTDYSVERMVNGTLEVYRQVLQCGKGVG